MCPVCVGLIGTSMASAVSGGTLAALLVKLRRGESVRGCSDTGPTEPGAAPRRTQSRQDPRTPAVTCIAEGRDRAEVGR